MMQRLHANENFINSLDFIKESFFESLSKISLQNYPDSQSKDLRTALSKHANVSEENIICGNGSDELIKMILESQTTPGDSVVIPVPTFSEYKKMAQIAHCTVWEIPANSKTLKHCTEQIVHTAKIKNAAVTFICSPNNPTGLSYDHTDLIKIASIVPGTLVIDEAYGDFSSQGFLPAQVLPQNVILLRTFSKALSGAGIRLGYAIGSKEKIEQLNRVKMPYNLSQPTQIAGLCLLKYKKHLMPSILEIKRERQCLLEKLFALSSKHFECFHSQGNFILIRTPFSQSIYNALLEKGLKVRNFPNDPFLSNCLRFSLGSQAVNSILYHTIKEVISP